MSGDARVPSGGPWHSNGHEVRSDGEPKRLEFRSKVQKIVFSEEYTEKISTKESVSKSKRLSVAGYREDLPAGSEGVCIRQGVTP